MQPTLIHHAPAMKQAPQVGQRHALEVAAACARATNIGCSQWTRCQLFGTGNETRLPRDMHTQRQPAAQRACCSLH